MKRTLEDGWKNASEEVRQAYGSEYVEALLEGIKGAGQTSAPNVEPVLDAMQEAICSESPQYRYLVHGGTKPLDWYCVSSLVPSSVNM